MNCDRQLRFVWLSPGLGTDYADRKWTYQSLKEPRPRVNTVPPAETGDKAECHECASPSDETHILVVLVVSALETYVA